MKYNVMLKILMLLLQKRKVTATEIAQRYEVSVRSVYRYVEELTVCGVPIDVARGRYGGITIADTFRLPTGYFTREEYAATLNALDAMSSQISDESLISAREKLESRQKIEKRELSVCGNVIVDGGTWGGSAKFSEKMRVCEQAVNDSKSLLIDYISREGEHSKRVIDPHVLIFKQNVWYVWAFCHTKQEFRTFKIGRIKSASFTGKTFTKKEFNRDDVDLVFKRNTEEFTEVTFIIEKNSLADAEEWLGIDNIEPHGTGFTATLTLPDDDVLVNKILSYGGAVKVASPPELKERVKAAAKKIAEDI
ncbi:MAG: YafY family transcriptional regulator [Clostridia bacterium]|nr:YafY family transcriptional regulator [Clostridia bacterium]